MIRASCFKPFPQWSQPTGDEIRELLGRGNLTGAAAGSIVGVESRTVRRWTGGHSPIPYAAWAVLCDVTGCKDIWKS